MTAQTKPIPRVEPNEPLALRQHAIIAAEATQRAFAALHNAAREAGMDDVATEAGRAWHSAKMTAEMARDIPKAENITPPFEVRS